eukprot:6411135-Heterocapsa_arctica.AAC.1
MHIVAGYPDPLQQAPPLDGAEGPRKAKGTREAQNAHHARDAAVDPQSTRPGRVPQRRRSL